ncbi:MAG: hypothetical protein JXR31_13860 [Prolixibacteraceae bacterium]|nr:hypothetical protein [Prolixibacteraceae bacterium]MBN2775337.1 hypothetical protein [Prolixibacteraceae bacterium]
MKKTFPILIIILIFFFFKGLGQEENNTSAKWVFKGQLSAYTHFNPNNNLPVWTGLRYIPQTNLEFGLGEKRMIDFEASANGYGNLGFDPFSESDANGDLKPYRFWGRYSSRQFEFRVGLQKINFGSATMLRPLMWFDQLDPRDPLQLTDGVWAALARYYFLNNTNIWVWGLYGNKNKKGWEITPTTKREPEYGGRIQMPVPGGEAALSFHHRKSYEYDVSEYPALNENRFGFDAKFDTEIGWWVEGSWASMPNAMQFKNQEIINIGMDYTFDIGNGITIIYEQLFAALDEKPFAFDKPITFSLLNVTYPIGLFDNLSAIVYYDWTNNSAYNFINWQKQFNNLSLFVMGYINPKEYNIPTQAADEILFAGSGVQVMVVINH